MVTMEERGIETSPHPFPAICEHHSIEKYLCALVGHLSEVQTEQHRAWSRVSLLSLLLTLSTLSRSAPAWGWECQSSA